MDKLKRPTRFNTQHAKAFKFERRHPKRLQTEYLQDSGSLPSDPRTGTRGKASAAKWIVAGLAVLALIALVVLTVIIFR